MPWRTGRRICLLSLSAIKKKAVAHWLARQNIANDFECVEPPETGCPQPAGESGAFECIGIRMRDTHKDADTIYIAVENFIKKNKYREWLDWVAIGITYVHDTAPYNRVTKICVGQFSNYVPPGYYPIIPTKKGPCGFVETVGKAIHADMPYIAHDDWAHHVHPNNICRHTQIFDAMWTIHLRINAQE